MTKSLALNHLLIYLIDVADVNHLEDAFGLEEMNDEAIARYRNPDNDPKGPWTSVPAIAQAGHGTKNQFYSFTAPNGITYNPPSGSCWRLTLDKMKEAISKNKIWFGSDGNGVPRIKKYLSEGKQGLTPESMISADKGGTNDSGKRELVELFEGIAVFETPKPTDLVKNFITISSDDAIVVDFFSGSATTAQAVMRKNSEDGGSRQFILVQLPEQIAEDKEAYKAGYRTIDEIGQERIKRAAAKIREENPLFAGDLGFKHYTLRDVPENVLDKIIEFDPNMSGFANNLLEMFGRETVLETWKVRDGYGLNAKVEEVALADYTAYQCGDHLYLTDEGMSDEAITALVDKYGEQTDWGPHYVVLFGYSFNFGATDALKKNLPLLNEGEKQIKINIDIRY